MNIIKLYNICKNKQDLITKLRSWQLVPKEGEYFCPKCGGPFALTGDSSRQDGWRWRCTDTVSARKIKRKKCLYSRTFRQGTFFAKSKLSIFQILGFVNLWVSNASLTLITEQLEISKPVAVDWASFCREVVLEAFFTNSEKLGGPGVIVEINESKFGKRKYHRGHNVEGQWVFGGFERGSGRVFMVAVDKRDTDTLLLIIEKWIEKGTTIYSDCWKADDCLSQEGYQHLTVNHSIHFKGSETGIRTNSIESSWRRAKEVTISNGQRKGHIPGNLARYMFYKSCAQQNTNRTEEFFKFVSKLYDAKNPVDNSNSLHVADEEEYSDLETGI